MLLPRDNNQTCEMFVVPVTILIAHDLAKYSRSAFTFD